MVRGMKERTVMEVERPELILPRITISTTAIMINPVP